MCAAAVRARHTRHFMYTVLYYIMYMEMRSKISRGTAQIGLLGSGLCSMWLSFALLVTCCSF